MIYDKIYLGDCKVFIRVIGPDGMVFDAIGETEQLTIKGNHPQHYHPSAEMYDDRILRRPGFPYYTDIHIDIARFVVSQQDAPVDWEAEQEALPPVEVKKIGPGDASHSA